MIATLLIILTTLFLNIFTANAVTKCAYLGNLPNDEQNKFVGFWNDAIFIFKGNRIWYSQFVLDVPNPPNWSDMTVRDVAGLSNLGLDRYHDQIPHNPQIDILFILSYMKCPPYTSQIVILDMSSKYLMPLTVRNCLANNGSPTYVMGSDAVIVLGQWSKAIVDVSKIFAFGGADLFGYYDGMLSPLDPSVIATAQNSIYVLGFYRDAYDLPLSGKLYNLISVHQRFIETTSHSTNTVIVTDECENKNAASRFNLKWLLFFNITFVWMSIIYWIKNTNTMTENNMISLQSLQSETMTELKNSNNTLPNHPSLVVIGSTNGGTSLLNDLFAFYLKSFSHQKKRYDRFYWSKCYFCNNTKKNQLNLCKIKKNVRNVNCLIDEYLQRISPDLWNSAFNKLYSGDRCSGYNTKPFVPQIMSLYFAETIFIYSIREKLTQSYSRMKNFRLSGSRSIYAFNQEFRKISSQIFNAKIENKLIPLLNQTNQSEETRNEIIRVALSKHNGWSDHSYQNLAVPDLCPYINVLIWMKSLKEYNDKSSFYKLKLVQSEWLYENIVRSAKYVHCIVNINDSKSEDEMNECMEYYKDTNNMNQIMSVENQRKLSNNTFTKNQKYSYHLSDIDTFDKLSRFFEICDKNLFDLIHEFPSLQIGTDWNIDRWTKQRNLMRQHVLENNKNYNESNESSIKIFRKI